MGTRVSIHALERPRAALRLLLITLMRTKAHSSFRERAAWVEQLADGCLAGAELGRVMSDLDHIRVARTVASLNYLKQPGGIFGRMIAAPAPAFEAYLDLLLLEESGPWN